MAHGKRIGLKDRQRVFELASRGLSVRQIAERMGISLAATKYTLKKGLLRCARCGRVIGGGDLCPVCSLPTEAPFGERLRAFRTAADFSQERFASQIAVPDERVRHWESGRKPPTEHQLQMLAEALGVTVQELTGQGESQKDG